MKSCTVDILKTQFEKNTNKWLTEFNKDNDVEYVMGEALFVSKVEADKLESFFNTKLKELQPELAGHASFVQTINPSTIRIKPDWDGLVQMWLEAESEGFKSILHDSKKEHANILSSLTDEMMKSFSKDQDSLMKFTKTAIDNLNKLKDIREIKQVVDDVEARRDIISALNYLRSNIDGDLESKVSAFISFLVSTKTQTESLLNLINNLDDQGKFIKAKSIQKTANSHKKLIEELHSFFSGVEANNPIKSLLKDTMDNMKSIDEVYLKTANEAIGGFLWDNEFDTDKYKAETKALEDKIQRYKDSIKLAGSNEKRSALAKKKLDQYEKELSERVTNSKDIQDILLGKKGDIAYTESLFLSGERHPDIIVSGLAKYYRKLMGEVNAKAHIPLNNRVQVSWNKLLAGRKADGKGAILNPESYGKRFIHKRMKYYLDDGEKAEMEVLEFKHGIDPKYYEKIEELQREVQYHSNLRRQSSGDEYTAHKINELKARQKLYDFFEENSSRRYTEEYYQVEKDFTAQKIKLLKERGVDLDNVFTPIQEKIDKLTRGDRLILGRYAPLSIEDRTELKRLRNEKFKLKSVTYQFSQLRKALEVLGEDTVFTDELIADQYADLKTKYQAAYADLFTEYDDKMIIAETLTAHQKGVNDRHEYVLKTDEYDGVDKWQEDIKILREEYNNGTITKEEFNSVYNQLTEIRYVRTDGIDFQDVVNDLNSKQTEIIKKIVNLSGYEEGQEAKEAYDKMRNTVKPYRLEGNVIRGDMMTSDEQKAVTDWEQQSIELQEGIFKKLGIDSIYFDRKLELDDLRQQRSAAYHNMMNNKGNAALKEEYFALKVKVDEMKAIVDNIKLNFFKDNPEIAKLYGEYNTIINEKQTFIERIPTTHYEEELTRQKDLFINKERPLDVTTFKNKAVNTTYTRKGNKWFTDADVDVTDDIMNIWKITQEEAFEKSEWFNNNHVIKNVYNSETFEYEERHVPSYSWIQTQPNKDTKAGAKYYRKKVVNGKLELVGVETPSMVYRKKQVREGLQSDPSVLLHNEQAIDEVSGLPKPKEGKFKLDNELESYEEEFLREHLAVYVESQAKYPIGRRMGYRIPTIERQFNVMESTEEMFKPKNIWKNILRTVTTTAQDIDEGEGFTNTVLADTNLNKVQSMPHYYSSYLDSELISTNILSSVLKYGYMANETEFKYKHFELGNELDGASIEDVYTSVLDVLDKGNVITGEKDAKSLKETNHLNRMAQAAMGISTADIEKKYGENARLRIVSDMVKVWFYGGAVDDKSKFTVWGKNFRLDKTLNTARGMKSFTLLASSPLQFFTWFKELANMANSVFNSVILSLGTTGQINFSLRQYGNAVKDYTLRYQKDLFRDYYDGKIGDKSHFGSMLDYFEVQEGNVKDISGEPIFKKSHIRKLFSTDFFWVVKNGAELFNLSTVFIAYMKSNFLIRNGVEISYFDAFEQVDGEMKLKSGVTNKEGNPVDVTEIRTDIQRVLRITQGAYAQLDKPLIARTWYGAGLIWMKQFFIEFMMVRFGKRQYNTNEARHIEGYWRQSIKSMWDALHADPRAWKILTGDNFGYDELSEEDKFAIKKSITEITMILSMYVLVSMMFGYDEDDDDRLKKLADNHDITNWILYSALKAQSELESTSPVGGMDETWRTLKGIPKAVLPFLSEGIMKLHDDIEYWGVIPVGLKETKRDTYGFDKGTTKIYKDIVKLIGITNPNKESGIEKIKGIEYSKQVK